MPLLVNTVGLRDIARIAVCRSIGAWANFCVHHQGASKPAKIGRAVTSQFQASLLRRIYVVDITNIALQIQHFTLDYRWAVDSSYERLRIEGTV
jgi:hypothetical protein